MENQPSFLSKKLTYREWLGEPRNLANLLYVSFAAVFVATVLLYYGIDAKMHELVMAKAKGDATREDFLTLGIDYASKHFNLLASALLVCFSGVAFVRLWIHIIETLKRLKRLKEEYDYGSVFLALAMLGWGIAGVVSLSAEYWGWNGSDPPKFVIILLSTLNSACFLLAVYYFRYGNYIFDNLLVRQLAGTYFKINRDNYQRVVFGITAGFICLEVFSFLKRAPIEFIQLLDFYFSIFPVLALLIVLWETFSKRKLMLFSWLSLGATVFTFFVQIWALFDYAREYSFFTRLALLDYKIMLVLLFFALEMSWIWEEQSEELKEKNRQINEQRRDMNHAIRRSLSNLETDLQKLANENMNHTIRRSLSNLETDLQKLSGEQKNAPVDFLTETLDRVHHIYLLHNHLHEENHDLTVLDLSSFLKNLAEYLEKSHRYEASNFHASIRLDNLPYLSPRYVRDIGSIVLELALNAYRYTHAAEKWLRIEAFCREDWVVVEVTDKGKGYDPSSQKNFGMKNISNIIRALDGTFEFERQSPCGTLFKVSVPIPSPIKITSS